MELTKITVNNFRSIKKQELVFPHNFIVLVGINESGKSNILRAVSLLDPAATVTKDDIRDAGHDEGDVVSESWVRFHFRLGKEEIAEVYKALESQVLRKHSKTTILDIGSRAYDLAAFSAHKSDVLYIVDLMTGKRRFSHWSLQGAQFKIHPQWKKVRQGTKAIVEIDGTSFDLSKYVLVNTEDYPSIPAESLGELDIAALNSMVGTHSTSLAEDNMPKSILWEYNERNLLPAKVPLAVQCEPGKLPSP
ncbi:MAG: AAA family ATPase [Candidatus Geothermincolia bacterium]